MNAPPVRERFTAAQRLHKSGQRAGALALYQRILGDHPDHAPTLHMLGVLAMQDGKHEEAIGRIRRAIEIEPRGEFFSNLGLALGAQGKVDEAVAAYRESIRLNPKSPEAHNNIGILLVRQGKMDAAIEALQTACKLKPDHVDAFKNLAKALRKAGKFPDAAKAYRRILELQPDNPMVLTKLGTTLLRMRKNDEAVDVLRKAVQLKGDNPEALGALGNALLAVAKFEEALTSIRRAVALMPDSPDIYNSLGCVLYRLARFDEAMVAYQRALAVRPGMLLARWNLALLLLSKGDLARGFQEFEARWHARELPLPPRKMGRPRWLGDDLGGKKIFLHGEQGFGDTIQFARFVPMVEARGGKVILACQETLVELMRSVPGIHRVIGQTKGKQKVPRFDVHCPLMSLALALNIDLKNLPAKVPYLTPPPDRVEQWRERLVSEGPGLRVGLTWGGNSKNPTDIFRSTTLAALASLAKIAGVRFFSLQKGDAREQLKAAPPGMEIVDLTEDLKDFADTAAMIANLDLVISVDTAVAHLAGALAKPVWILLPTVPEWRWLEGRTDSPWYPTARLFQQTRFGEWHTPVEAMVMALGDFAH